jgi:hypothetical protein
MFVQGCEIPAGVGQAREESTISDPFNAGALLVAEQQAKQVNGRERDRNTNFARTALAVVLVDRHRIASAVRVGP